MDPDQPGFTLSRINSSATLVYNPSTAYGTAVDSPDRCEGQDNFDPTIRSRPARGRTSSTILVRRSSDLAVKDAEAELEIQGKPASSYHVSYILPITATFVALAVPWVVFTSVRANHGVAASLRVSRFVTRNPQTVNFLATHFGTVFAAITALLFSTAVVRFAQKWIVDRGDVEMLHISFFTDLRHQRFPGSFVDWSSIIRRWYLVIILAVSIFMFNFIPSGISVLLSPIPFNRTVPLIGAELDFGSSSPDCVAWLKQPRIRGECNWAFYKGFRYTTCLGENQLVDAIEAGRGNLFSLVPNNTKSQILTQLGSRDGLRFLGPTRGVLPMGPNGVPAFDTLHTSPISNPDARIRSYQYTLGLQGFSSQIKCEYAASSPIAFNRIQGLDQTNGSCPLGQEVLPARTRYLAIVSNFTLGFWACGQGNRNVDGNFASYLLYLRGYRIQDRNIGNITCTLSSVRHAVFDVRFSQRSGVFTAQNATHLSRRSPSDLIRQSILGLGAIVSEGQGAAGNTLSESVITFAVKLFGLSPSSRNETYLGLFEAMLQGIIEYEATYIRLVYTASATDDPAASLCMRPVNGTATYEVIGWFYQLKTFAFLIPTTAVNLASLILLLVTMYKGDQVLYQTDPTVPESLLGATKGIHADGSKIVVELAHDRFWEDLWQATVRFFTSGASSSNSGYKQMPGVEDGVGKKS